jgi:hypothetical protein
MNLYILLCSVHDCKKAWFRGKEDYIYCVSCFESVCDTHSTFINNCPICNKPLHMDNVCYADSSKLAAVNDNITNQTSCDWHLVY